MVAVLKVELVPFSTPNFVLEKTAPRPRDEGFKEPRSHALHEVDSDTLSIMCDDFRAEVFRKAMKKDPRSVRSP